MISAAELETHLDNADPFVTDSLSPTNARLALVAVAAIDDGGTAPGESGRTLDGNGQTWTAVRNVTHTNGASWTARLELWSAHVTSVSAGALTATFTGAQPREVATKVVEFTEVPSSGAVIQSASATGNGTAIAVTLAAFADAVNNAAYLVAVQVAATTPAISFATLTELGADQSGTFGGPNGTIAHAWQVGQDTSPDATSDQSSHWFAIAAEIDNEAGASASSGAGVNREYPRGTYRGAMRGAARRVMVQVGKLWAPDRSIIRPSLADIMAVQGAR